MIEVATGAPTETLLEATVEPTTAPVAATDVPATDAPVAETGAPTIAITQPPTILTEAPTVPLTLIDYLPDYSVEAILNPTSPQAFALLFVNYDVNIDTRTPEQLVQRFALATLYFALGRSWTQGSVLPSEEECTWFEDTGSYCNEDGFQEGLLLENNNLEDGPIPPEIGLLTSLKVVDMSDNEIVGDIPTYFGQLTILETLRLARNERLMGTVPTELENIPTLQELDLSGLEFVTGTIPEGLCDVPNLLFDCSPTLCGCDSCQCEAPQ
eukprot:Sro944_g223020.1 Leucine Rich Repeat (269) ;mRNA; r:38822-39628